MIRTCFMNICLIIMKGLPQGSVFKIYINNVITATQTYNINIYN